jgi:hypothetical protein
MQLKEPILTTSEGSDEKNSQNILKSLSIFDILTIQEPLDVVLMFFGFIAAMVTGASIPAFNVLMGQLINEINDQSSGFGSSISVLVYALLSLALINLCSGTIQVIHQLHPSHNSSPLLICDRFIVGHAMVSDRQIG